MDLQRIQRFFCFFIFQWKKKLEKNTTVVEVDY